MSAKDISSVSKVTLPTFEVVAENTSDTPIKTQVEQHIAVSDEITEENLRALLWRQYADISKRRGFQYHESPTNIFIYLYETENKAKAGQGLWLAMLQKGYSEEEPTLTVRTDQLDRLGQEPRERFGLTEAKRQEAFRELARLERKATDEAMERYPSDINSQIALERELEDEYKRRLAASYNLTPDQLQAIMLEGVKSQWEY